MFKKTILAGIAALALNYTAGCGSKSSDMGPDAGPTCVSDCYDGGDGSDGGMMPDGGLPVADRTPNPVDEGTVVPSMDISLEQGEETQLSFEVPYLPDANGEGTDPNANVRGEIILQCDTLNKVLAGSDNAQGTSLEATLNTADVDGSPIPVGDCVVRYVGTNQLNPDHFVNSSRGLTVLQGNLPPTLDDFVITGSEVNSLLGISLTYSDPEGTNVTATLAPASFQNIPGGEPSIAGSFIYTTFGMTQVLPTAYVSVDLTDEDGRTARYFIDFEVDNTANQVRVSHSGGEDLSDISSRTAEVIASGNVPGFQRDVAGNYQVSCASNSTEVEATLVSYNGMSSDDRLSWRHRNDSSNFSDTETLWNSLYSSGSSVCTSEPGLVITFEQTEF